MPPFTCVVKKILKFLRRETWFRTPREERRLKVIENKLLKIMQTLDVQLSYVQRILRDKEIPNSWYALDIAIGSSCQKSRNGNMYISRPTRCTSSCNVSLLIITGCCMQQPDVQAYTTAIYSSKTSLLMMD